ncbi:hypothetical protein THAOC_32594 [Thalassiosira oceanica]|uniref:Uncharacterized protein n=1 Tax=Thalassiosira oceanica TaxID=159749 RepID=K0R6V1_THAOC|nr:hypothetical protein THAOC_32594 [Thalassiosira oceanica]|eukprot:EJK48595.1 hypothetical protein THAOC_32594 [Thalassiosira oceanica]
MSMSCSLAGPSSTQAKHSLLSESRLGRCQVSPRSQIQGPKSVSGASSEQSMHMSSTPMPRSSSLKSPSLYALCCLGIPSMVPPSKSKIPN